MRIAHYISAGVLLFAMTPGLALANDPFELIWSTLDGGGGVSTEAGFELSGTVAQPDAGVLVSDEGFSLEGGYWVAPAQSPPICPADFDSDGFVDFFDFDLFVSCFEDAETCPPGKSADFDGDGFVDFFDFDAFVAAFEAGC